MEQETSATKDNGSVIVREVLTEDGIRAEFLYKIDLGEYYSFLTENQVHNYIRGCVSVLLNVDGYQPVDMINNDNRGMIFVLAGPGAEIIAQFITDSHYIFDVVFALAEKQGTGKPIYN